MIRCFVFLAILLVTAPAFTQTNKKIAITIDDLPWIAKMRDDGVGEWITESILGHLNRYNAPAIGFVNERKLQANGKPRPGRVALLQKWLEAGMDLGNHAWSHMDYHTHDFEAFREDVLKGEIITRPMVEEAGRNYQYFRHPFLHTGDSPEKQKALADFLKAKNYIEAPVTIDNSEWIYARAYDHALLDKDTVMMDSLGKSYVAYMAAKLTYYEGQSQKLFDRNINHILLIHANTINADYLDDLIVMMQGRGYEMVTLSEALEDPVYEMESTYTGRGGISWLDRWALTRGEKGDFFKGEPRLEEFVQEVAGIRE